MPNYVYGQQEINFSVVTYRWCFVLCTDEQMAVSLMLLPLLLPESQITVASGKGRKRVHWKPSTAESMTFFVDVQAVTAAVQCLFIVFVIQIFSNVMIVYLNIAYIPE